MFSWMKFWKIVTDRNRKLVIKSTVHSCYKQKKFKPCLTKVLLNIVGVNGADKNNDMTVFLHYGNYS